MIQNRLRPESKEDMLKMYITFEVGLIFRMDY